MYPHRDAARGEKSEEQSLAHRGAVPLQMGTLGVLATLLFCYDLCSHTLIPFLTLL